jgi:hypothetical protein
VALVLSLLTLWLPAHALAVPDSWTFAGPGSPAAGLGTFAAKARGSTNYAGQTRQDAPVVVEIAGANVKSVDIFWYAQCTSGKGFDFGGPITAVRSAPPMISEGENFLFGAKIAKSGRFKGKGLGSVDLGDFSGALSERVQGKLSANAAVGSFSAHLDIIEKATGKTADSCDTGNVTWKAPAPQSLFYGGSSTQGQPVVIQVAADKRRVKMLRIAWFADCASKLGVDFGDAFTDFPLTRGGSFGDSFTQTYPDDTGGHADYAYVLSGKVGRRNASGSFHVVVTITDANGAVTDTCMSPTVRWSARQ